MFTCCPDCQTCFRITEAQLSVARGLVRCGHCQKVFNGRENLTAAPPVQTPDDFSLDTHDADEHIFAESPAATGEDTEHLDLPSFSARDDFDLEEEPPATTEEPATEPVPEFDNFADDWFLQAEDREEQTTADSDTPLKPADGEGYAYADIADQLEEEQDIEQMFSEMHRQLEQGMAELEKNPPGSGILSETPAAENPPPHGDAPEDDARKSDFPKDDFRATPKKPTPDDEEEINRAIDSIFADSELPLYGEQRDEEAYRVEKEMLAAFGKDTRIDTSSDNIRFEDEAVSLDDLPRPPETEPPATAETAAEAEIPRRLRGSPMAGPERRSPWKIAGGLLLILLLLAALLGQLALFRGLDIVRYLPQARPWLEQFCRHAPCRLHARRDLDQIRILERDIRAHPQEKNALLITATIVNRASFPQPYPDMLVTLSDLTGGIVAERRFTPADYLGKLNSPFLLMKPGTPVHIRIGVRDPGRDAVNFEFRFL